MKQIILLRFSATGDVAMLATALKNIQFNTETINFLVVSQPRFSALFKNINGVDFVEADIYGKYSKINGILKLFSYLKSLNPNLVIDLHKVIRSRILSALFFIFKTKTFSFSKGKIEKRKLISRKNKKLVQLTNMVERYQNAIIHAISSNFNEKVEKKNSSTIIRAKTIYDNIKIGIAPFAKHRGKCYDIDKMEIIVEKLSQKPNTMLFLFGEGSVESDILKKWEQKYNNVISVANKHSLEEELNIISQLNLMVSMDSANMHFASLVNISVISIWGATHSCSGFYGWQQNPNNIIQKDIPCRPCSVFGEKKCYKNSYECLDIDPEYIINQIKNLLSM